MTLQSIKDEYMKEVTRVCQESGLDVAQVDIIERMGSIIFDKAYVLGLEKGWQFEQDNARMQREDD